VLDQRVGASGFYVRDHERRGGVGDNDGAGVAQGGGGVGAGEAGVAAGGGVEVEEG